MIIVAGYIDVDPESRESFLVSRQDAIAATRTEPGCLDYVFSADSSDPARVRVFERWESDHDLDVHLAARAASAQTPATAAVRDRELLRYEISEVRSLRG
jgi:quinol monooxygenase YgiN